MAGMVRVDRSGQRVQRIEDGKVLRGYFGRTRVTFDLGQLVAVITSPQARTFHWLRIREQDPPQLASWHRALCGARPGGWVMSWAVAEEDAETPSPASTGDWRYAPQVPACERCETKKNAR